MRLVRPILGGLVLAGLLGGVSAALAASGWQCGQRLVGTGQSPTDVYALCGEPTERSFETELVTLHLGRGVYVSRAVPVERWVYDRGNRRLVRYLTFRDGRLVDIDEGGYGY
jgi:hypothetical protein